MDKLTEIVREAILSSITKGISEQEFKQLLDKYIRSENYDKILLIIEILLETDPDNAYLYYLKATIFYRKSQLEESEIILIKANSLSKINNNLVLSKQCNSLMTEIKRNNKLYRFIEGKWGDKNQDFKINELSASREDFLKRQVAIEHGAPSILVISVARAGSSSIVRQLAKILRSPRVEVTSERIPIEHDMALGYLYDFYRGGAVTYVHSRANKKNLNALLMSKIKKFILHIRDPRQAFLSNYYRMHAENSWTYNRVYYNHLPLDYDEKDFSSQIDWQIENIYKDYWVGWIEEWCRIAEDKNNEFNIKITTYENFKNDPILFYQDIIDFYNLEPSDYFIGDLVEPNINPPTEVSGRTDFWRHKLSSVQIDKLQSLTPDGLLKKFNWSR